MTLLESIADQRLDAFSPSRGINLRLKSILFTCSAASLRRLAPASTFLSHLLQKLLMSSTSSLHSGHLALKLFFKIGIGCFDMIGCMFYKSDCLVPLKVENFKHFKHWTSIFLTIIPGVIKFQQMYTDQILKPKFAPKESGNITTNLTPNK